MRLAFERIQYLLRIINHLDFQMDDRSIEMIDRKIVYDWNRQYCETFLAKFQGSCGVLQQNSSIGLTMGL